MTDLEEKMLPYISIWVAPWKQFTNELQAKIAEKDVQIAELNKYIMIHDVAIGLKH